ncbi:hypothetical protein HY792_03850 [Candidatus Desantisbacteria bacterium]|nr:hypothetical protein [Candidatus Desantisbacteria bacterium]
MSITCKLTILTLCLCASVPLCLSSAISAVYPSELKIAPVKVYESILTNFKEKKIKNVKTALTFIDPIIVAINIQFGVDLNPEIQAGLKTRDDGFNIAVKRLLFYDIRLIFADISKGEEKNNLRVLFKMSYADYCLLSSEFLSDKTYFDIDRRIRKMFTKAYLDLGKESPYGEKVQPDINMFKRHADEIIDELSQVVQ